jgi:hypothetical protein
MSSSSSNTMMSGSLYALMVKARSIDKRSVGKSRRFVNNPTKIVTEMRNPKAIVPPKVEKMKILKPSNKIIEV